ncbi:FAD-dependent monooxygenase [Actinotalea sp. Marseille-Q4924]|uniref:FAD-dependent monooxygenase n=1 Tax=Actinotalea sp. Marseille-Q4924 TaxID=2866571 RepID=UPI001CE400B5|nr:FAD-dependent monooxygenase [Actinotalea sp. Marseille-Q4924]
MGLAVVVGAGIGGLAAAVGLRRRGWDVVVLERAPQFAPVGAGLTLMANGLAALDAIGVGASVRATVRPLEAMTFRSRGGRVLVRAAMPADAPSCGVHRATLHRLLTDALPDDVVRLGAEVTGVVGGSSPEVTYCSADGSTTTLPANLLVGADGVRSLVRSVLWPEARGPVAVGSTAWRGVTRGPTPLRDAEVSWGPGTEVGLVPLEDGRVYWYVSVTDDRIGSSRQGGAHADASALVDGWYAGVVDAVPGTDPVAVLRTELVHLRPGPAPWARGAVALLGDAAHAMPPYLGQGANQALEDAAVLAAVVAPDDDVPTALAEYDRRRRPRATRVARAAVRAGRTGQMVRSAAAVALRDRAIALAPAGMLTRAMGGVVRWHAPVMPETR